jgi:hypothetical protein
MRTVSRWLRFVVPIFALLAFTLSATAQDATPEATSDAMMDSLCPEGLAADMVEEMMMEMDMTAEPDMSMTEEMMPTEDMAMTEEMTMTEEMVMTEEMMATEETMGSSACLTAELSGANEVPVPGDEDGMGFAAVSLDASTGEVCWDVMVGNITLPADAMHIHVGAADVAGDVVVPAPSAPDAEGVATGCTSDADAALIEAIIADPSGYYVNVHTSDFPAGAVRGQLMNYDDTMRDDMDDMDDMEDEEMMETEEATEEADS